MNLKPDLCNRESEIVTAAMNGLLSTEMLEHLATCAVCSDAAMVSSFLSEAADDLSGAPLPSAGLIWWRAQLTQNRELAERSVASITIIRNIAICIALVLGTVCAAEVFSRNPGVLLIAGSGFLALLLSVIGVLYAWVNERI